MKSIGLHPCTLHGWKSRNPLEKSWSPGSASSPSESPTSSARLDSMRNVCDYLGSTLHLQSRSSSSAGPGSRSTLGICSQPMPVCPTRVRGFRGFSLSHNVRSQGEVDTLLKQAEEGGGRIIKSGHTADWGGYSGYFADPDGFLWEVAWNPRFPHL